MRIIHICQRDDPDTGGSLRVAEALIKEQLKEGHEAWILFLYGPPSIIAEKVCAELLLSWASLFKICIEGALLPCGKLSVELLLILSILMTELSLAPHCPVESANSQGDAFAPSNRSAKEFKAEHCLDAYPANNRLSDRNFTAYRIDLARGWIPG